MQCRHSVVRGHNTLLTDEDILARERGVNPANVFIRDIDSEAARRGMDQVKANRGVTVGTEQQRRAAPLDANFNGITEGKPECLRGAATDDLGRRRLAGRPL